LFLLSGTTLIWCYDNQINKDLPAWVYYYGCFCVFMLQTWDAVDGKHARKTNRASPLGQFLDHGLDSCTNSFIVIIMCQSNKFGNGICTLLLQGFTHALYFLHSWEEYHTGVFSTQVDNVGGTEFQYLAMFIILLPNLFTEEFLTRKFVGNFDAHHLVCLFICLIGIIHIYKSILKIHQKLVEIKPADQVYKSYFDLLPCAFIILTEVLLAYTNIFERKTLELMIFNGIIYGFYFLKYIVKIMSRSPYEFMSYDFIAYFALIVFSIIIDKPEIEIYTFGVFTLIVTFRYAKYFLSVVVQIKKYLNITF